tara:strand:- start:19 stop:468 length:450 start_codon:yes stop_codon:yes gene_type:complete
MKLNILLLTIFTILLYISPSLRNLFNTDLGKVVFFLITIYFFNQSPILGIIVVVLILVFKQYYTKDNNIPLEVIYKTKPQTPVTPLSDMIPHESGLELLSKELQLRSIDSNRHSIVKGSPSVCENGDLLCLYDNEPRSFNDNDTKKNNI